jgi:hypothetical protein
MAESFRVFSFNLLVIKEEGKEVYWTLFELVKNRLEKARSI